MAQFTRHLRTRNLTGIGQAEQPSARVTASSSPANEPYAARPTVLTPAERAFLQSVQHPQPDCSLAPPPAAPPPQPVLGIRQRAATMAERLKALREGENGHATEPVAPPQSVQREFAQLPAIHAPLIHERTRPAETIGRPPPYELTCELCPPGFVVEDVLVMFLSAYRRHKGGRPAHLYIHWHQLLDLMARTGSCIYNGIPVHAKRGLGFWTVMGTNYALAEEPVR